MRSDDSVAARRLAKSEWRAHLTGRSKADLRIGIAATFTAEPMVPYAGHALVQHGYSPDILLAPYNQLLNVCGDHQVVFGNELDVIVLLWRIEEMLPSGLEHASGSNFATAASSAEPELDIFVAALSALRKRFSGSIIVSLPPVPRIPGFDPLGVNGAAGSLFHKMISLAFSERVRGIEGVALLDLDAVERQCGTQAAWDARVWYLYRQPQSEAAMALLGNQLARLICAQRRPAAKVVILDCDNTLWGGVVGEDGLDGIAIGQDFPGAAFRDLQLFLASLRNRGILLALASKNNEEDVRRVFDLHDGMILKWNDFTSHRICWRPKAETIPEIADELNLGLSSFVFIDDNPSEIESVRALLPEVNCVLLPEEPAHILDAVRHLWLFDQIQVTNEDSRRAQMMTEAQQRKVAAEAMTPQEFLKSLNLSVEVFPARTEHLGRITQLINKTNQFNLTTARRTLDEVRQLSQQGLHRVFGASVHDRFGDYGLTGVAIVAEGDSVWELDTFLLSCRVLGKGVEQAVLAALARGAQASGVERLRGFYRPTAKNQVAALFYESAGFRRVGDEAWESLAVDAATVPPHIDLVAGPQPS